MSNLVRMPDVKLIAGVPGVPAQEAVYSVVYRPVVGRIIFGGSNGWPSRGGVPRSIWRLVADFRPDREAHQYGDLATERGRLWGRLGWGEYEPKCHNVAVALAD